MSKSNIFYCFALMFFILTLVYSNHFDNSFHFDDFHTILNNVYIRDLSNWNLFFTDASTFSSLPTSQTYRPLTVLSISADYWLGKGYHTFYFHVSTFIWYFFLITIMYFLLIKIFSSVSDIKNENRLISFLAVTFYAFHTANAETVNYIIQRADVFSAVFSVLCLVIYIYYPLKRKFYLYLIPIIVGVLAKQPTIMILPILFLYIFLFELNLSINKDLIKTLKNNFKILSYKIAPTFICVLFMTIFVVNMDSETLQTSAVGKANWYRLSQPFVILIYLKTFFFPIHLSADTDLSIISSFLDSKIYLGILGLIILIYFAIYFTNNKKTKPIAFGIFWFLLALFPTSWVSLAEVLNDHRTFFPYIGLVISASWVFYLIYLKLIEKYSNLKVALAYTIILGSIIYLNAYGTFQRNKVWDNETSLWEDVSVKSPKNGRGLMNYGLQLMQIGKFSEAKKYFLEALAFTPNYSNLHTNLGIVSNALGEMSDSEKYFKKGVELSNGTQGSYLFYANFLKNHNRLEEAKNYYEKGLVIANNDFGLRHQLMETYQKLKNFQALNLLATETLKIVPNDSISLFYLNGYKNSLSSSGNNDNKSISTLINESLSYYNLKQYDKCIEYCNLALKKDPKNVIAYNNICSAYNMLGNYQKGKEAGEMAIKLDPNNQLAKNNLNWSISELNKE